MKIWGILRKNHKILRDVIIENSDESLTPQQQLEECLHEICYRFDIPKPLWLSKHQEEFERFSRTTFRSDHFMEDINFDAFEIEAIIEKNK